MTDILVLPSTVKNSFILDDKVILQVLSKLDEVLLLNAWFYNYYYTDKKK